MRSTTRATGSRPSRSSGSFLWILASLAGILLAVWFALRERSDPEGHGGPSAVPPPVSGSPQHASTAALRAAVADLADELSTAGFAPDFDALRVEISTSAEIVKRMEPLMDPVSSRIGYMLDRALGLWKEDLPAHRIARMTRSADLLEGVYVRADRCIVIPDGPEGAARWNDRVLIHELAHAWQDRWLEGRPTPRTIEEANILDCVVEGQADLIEWQTTLRRSGRRVEEFGPDVPYPFYCGFGRNSDNRLQYMIGASFLLEQLRTQGQAAITEALGSLPASTEQMIHPEKAHDAPSIVDLPPPESDDWDETTLGELGCYRVLAALGRSKAYRAAAGWDGDRVRVERIGDEDWQILARTVFDRESDAEEFADEWKYCDTASLSRSGPVVDLTWGSTPAMRAAAMQRMRGHASSYVPDEADSATAARASEHPPWREPPRISRDAEGRSWMWIPGVSVRIPVLEEWSFQRILTNGQLFRTPTGVVFNPFATPQVGVDVLPYLGEETLAGLHEWIRRYIPEDVREGTPIETVRISGHEAALAGWEGDEETRRLPGLSLVLLEGSKVIHVQVRTLMPGAPLSEDARDLLLGIETD